MIILFGIHDEHLEVLKLGSELPQESEGQQYIVLLVWSLFISIPNTSRCFPKPNRCPSRPGARTGNILTFTISHFQIAAPSPYPSVRWQQTLVLDRAVVLQSERGRLSFSP